MTRAVVTCSLGVALVDLEDEEVLGLDADAPVRERPTVELPLVVAADALGSRVVAVVSRRPPLMVSDDAGTTWREAGGGLPPGRDVAISPEHPDRILFASESRLFVSEDGGRFWRSLTPELDDIRAVAWDETSAS
jgi:hypothetical protein